VHHEVVLLDLGEVGCVVESGGLVQVAGVGPEHRQLGQLVPVALEVVVVDGVEPDQRGEQADVGLGDGVADQVPAGAQVLGQDVQAVEQSVVGPFVGLLAAREPGLIDGVVDVGENVGVDGVDLVAQRFGVEVGRAGAVELAPLRGQVEGDLREVVGDDLAAAHVDDGGHGDAQRILGVVGEEGLLQPLDAQHGVAAAGVEVEGPAALVVRRAADSHGQHVFQAEEPAHDRRAVRPRAGPRDDQPVAAGLDGEAVPTVGGDAGGQVALVAHVLADSAVLVDCHRVPPVVSARP
jgi:hypothetical protein